MSEQAWAKEPWQVSWHASSGQYRIRSMKSHFNFITAVVDNETNAERIVACVNPMKGIPDPAVLRKLLNNFRKAMTADDRDIPRWTKLTHSPVSSILCDLYDLIPQATEDKR